jgi:glycosyltransferase involved in cell wall biosynthesis
MTDDLVTVIIPCFQQGRFLKECIASLQAQTYSNWEAIVINDGSSDETEIVCKELIRNECRIRYIRQENQGVSSARNTGISIAKGAFIQFLDPDDKLECNKIKHQVDFLRNNPHFDAVNGSTLYFSDTKPNIFRRVFQEGDLDYDWVAEAVSDKRPLLNKILERNIFSICAPIFRRKLIDRTGLFDASLSRHEDWDYFIRAAMKDMKIAYQPGQNSNVFVRTHGASLSQDRVAMAESMLVVRLKTHPLLQETHIRRKNLINMMGLLGAVSRENIPIFKNEIYLSSNFWHEKLFVSALSLISVDGPFFFVVKHLVPLLPSIILRFLGISSTAAKALKSMN